MPHKKERKKKKKQNTKVLISEEAFLLGFTVAIKLFCQECLL
jgi:hypothetical protein